MANPEHVAKLKEGVPAWNSWRAVNSEITPELTDADLSGCDLAAADLRLANLGWANLYKANLSNANLQNANLDGANLNKAVLANAQLQGAYLEGADLYRADFKHANLAGAVLRGVSLVETDLSGADLTGCAVYGLSVWNVNLDGAMQSKLLITRQDEAPLRVDDLEVAQFVYLLLNRKKLRSVITTMGEKAVLILGRFTERKELLDRMADKLRSLDFLPMIFDFDRPTDLDLTETVKVLAGLSRFVIADITNPRSVPLELQATVPDYEVPFVTIVEKGQPVFGMFDDLPRKYNWALTLMEYRSADTLLATFERNVVAPALEKSEEVRLKKAALPARRSADD